MKFANMPIGTALILSVAFGLSAGIGDIVERLARYALPDSPLTRIPAAGVQAGIAWLVRNVGFVTNLLGDDISNFVAAASLTSGINDLVGLSDVVRNTMDYVAALIPARTPAITAPTPVAAPVEAATSGWPMGQATVAPGMDDIDLAVMAARGGHPSV
jgi:hypothetical protein